MKRLHLAGAAVLALLAPASAQTHNDTGGTVVTAFDPLAFAPANFWATLSASTAAAPGVAVPTTSTAPVLVVYNNGANAAYVALGATSAAAETAAVVNAVDVVQPGGCLAFRPGSKGYLAAITASSTTSLILSAGDGFPLGCGGGGGGGGGGGAVTATIGAYATGFSPDIGAYGSMTPYHGSGTPNVLNLLGGIEADARGAIAAQGSTGSDIGEIELGVAGSPVSVNTGAANATSPRQVVAQDPTTTAGANPGRAYQTVAASQSKQALSGGAGGALGDYLSHCMVFPTTVSPGNPAVAIYDGSVATAIDTVTGGTSAFSNLAPFAIQVGAVSVSGAWQITTGSGVSVTCTGKFT